MANYKRRIVYFTDDEWAELKIIARGQGMTTSAWIRSSIIYGSGGEDSKVWEELVAAGLRPPPKPPQKVSQAVIDDAYARLRPVPKPGRK